MQFKIESYLFQIYHKINENINLEIQKEEEEEWKK